MPNTLLLRLPAPGETDADWITLADGGGAPPLRQRGPLELAAAAAANARVVVLAPATQILLAEPELPPGSGAKLARAVPFALEEQLTEDVDALVFALGRRREGGGTPVAVVSRAALESWLRGLDAARIQPAALYADVALMPDNPGQIVLWLEESRLAVRRPGALPFVVELAPLADALVVAGVIAEREAGTDEPPVMESAILYATREDWARVQDEFESLLERFASIQVQLLPEGPLPWLARGLATGEAVNLLQGEYTRSADRGAEWRRWRVALALGGGLLAAHVAAEALQIHQSNRDVAQLDAQIGQVFAQTMPGEKPSDPRRQMQARLERIRRASAGPQNFLHALEAVSAATAATPHASLQGLAYRERALDLRVDAPNLVALSQFTQVVAQRGLSAEIQSSTPAGDGVEAHLQIRAAGTKESR